MATHLDAGPPDSACPTGTVTFLFSDIDGSTQRWERHREAMKARGGDYFGPTVNRVARYSRPGTAARCCSRVPACIALAPRTQQ